MTTTYRLVRTQQLPSLAATFHELEHVGTGARHIHIEIDDDNNAFSAIFMTVPKDSTGVPHILEHAVLNGSKKYPLPAFFSMITRSLSTFMNAMTSTDRTQYPFTTRNKTDYFNLLDVYLDAVFFPLLEEDTFMQEGHRFEFKKQDDPTSDLGFVGVVFNEMKAALASPATAMARAASQAMFPGLTYENWSGGDPARIPDLTWQQLKDFHATHYHPSNALFFTYGNFPLDETLEHINDRALKHFEKREVDVSIPDVARFKTPVKTTARYPLAANEDASRKYQALVSWVTTPVADSYATLAMQVISQTLLAHSGSTLRKALLDSGIGSTLADGSGFGSGASKEAVFGAGLKDISKDDVQKVEDLVLSVLRDVAENGLDKELVEGAIHQVEIDQRERSNAPFSFALRVLLRTNPAYVYGSDVTKSLDIEGDLKRLKEDAAEGKLEELVKTWLVDNPHRVTVVGEPDPGLEAERRAVETRRLAEVTKTLTEADKKRIVENSARLRARQENRGDTSVLPTLGPSDVLVNVTDADCTSEVVNGALIEAYAQPTGGLSYADFYVDLGGLDEEMLDASGVLSAFLSRLGAGDLDHAEMSKRVAKITGGVSVGVSVSQTLNNGMAAKLHIGSKALGPNQNDMGQVLDDFITAARFDPKRLAELIAERATQFTGAVGGLSLGYAQVLAGSHLSPAIALNERLSGASHARLIKKLAAKGQAGAKEICVLLEKLREELAQAGRFEICLTAEAGSIEAFSKGARTFASGLIEGSNDRPLPDATSKIRSQAMTAGVAVASNVMVFPAVQATHADAPALLVLTRYLWANHLHREIRERGGAYTSGAAFDERNGTFTLLSSSDPNIARTYDVFKAAAAAVTGPEITEQGLSEAILSVAKGLDPLESPDVKGRRTSVNRRLGLSKDVRETYFRKTLEVKADDLRRVAEKYLNIEKAASATFASEAAVEAAVKAGVQFELVESLF